MIPEHRLAPFAVGCVDDVKVYRVLRCNKPALASCRHAQFPFLYANLFKIKLYATGFYRQPNPERAFKTGGKIHHVMKYTYIKRACCTRRLPGGSHLIHMIFKAGLLNR